MDNNPAKRKPSREVTVTAAQNRFRADRALASLVKELGRKGAKVLFRRNAVLLNGRKADGADRVAPGDVLAFPDLDAKDNRALREQATAPRLKTSHGRHLPRLYEDEDILVLNKPAEVPTTIGAGSGKKPGGKGASKRETIEDVLKRAYPAPRKPKQRPASQRKAAPAKRDEEPKTLSQRAASEEDRDQEEAGLVFRKKGRLERAFPEETEETEASGKSSPAQGDDEREALDDFSTFLAQKRRRPSDGAAPKTSSDAAEKNRKAPVPKAGAEEAGFYLCHRLDTETTGCLLVAKTREARDKLTLDFKHRKIDKTYLAVVKGEPDWDEKCVKRPIAYIKSEEADPKAEQRQRRALPRAPEWVKRKAFKAPLKALKKGVALGEDEKGGKACETRFIVEERLRGYALLRCIPKTGRMHQLRIHLAAEGFPLAYDPLYGRDTPIRLKEFGIKKTPQGGRDIALNRQPLHASKLCFTHPRTGERMQVEAPLPKDFKEFIRVLRKHTKHAKKNKKNKKW